MQSLNRLRSNRPRKEYDFYETPLAFCDSAIDLFIKNDYSLPGSGCSEYSKWYEPPFLALDAGCGCGVWGYSIKKSEYWKYRLKLYGIDVQFPHNAYLDYYTKVIKQDFIYHQPEHPYNLVFGNPPYSRAEEFVRKALEITIPGGHVFFLLRLAFLESKKRYFGLYSEFRPKKVYVSSRRPSFFTTKNGRHTTDAISYAMFLWQKGWIGKSGIDWFYWNYDDNNISSRKRQSLDTKI